MNLDFDKIFSVYEHSLGVRAKRAEMIANNIANADTPGYEARDLDFREILSGFRDSNAMKPVRLSRSNDYHATQLIDSTAMEGLKYRNSTQPSIDGNTVDIHREKTEYAQNALRFQASFNFLNSRINAIKGALRGE